MRLTPLLNGLILTGILAGPLAAQTVPYAAVVSQPEAEVRCKPSASPAVYSTNLLKWGARVLVVEERDDGWLGIAPPEGSFSWINARFVARTISTQPNWPNWMVVADPQTKVPVLIGSALQKDDKRPTVEGAHLARGAQVRSIGPEKQDNDGSWLPIEPPAGEVRYLRAESVKKVMPVQTASAAGNPPREAELSTGTPMPGPVAVAATPTAYSTFVPLPAAAASVPGPAPAGAESLWGRAQLAERAGRVGEAVEIYRQLYRENVNTNREAAEWAIHRADFLSNGQRKLAPFASPVVPAAPVLSNASTYPPQSKYVPLRTEVLPPPVQPMIRGGFANPTGGEKSSGQGTGVIPARKEGEPTAQLHPPTIDTLSSSSATASLALTPRVPSTQKTYISGPGKLVRAGMRVGSLPTYRLITGQGNPTLYVTAAPGLDLERFVDQNVELSGPAEYRGEMRANHMQVQQVQPLPPTP